MPLQRELQHQGRIRISNCRNARPEMEEKQCHCVFSGDAPLLAFLLFCSQLWPFLSPIVRQNVARYIKGFFSTWRKLFGLDCRPIRRSAEDARRERALDKAVPGLSYKIKSLVIRKIALESTLQSHNVETRRGRQNSFGSLRSGPFSERLGGLHHR